MKLSQECKIVGLCIDEVCCYYNVDRTTLHRWYKSESRHLIVIAMIKFYSIKCNVNA